MSILTRKRKAIFALIIVAHLFIGMSAPALALFGGIKIPSASKIASDLEKRYNLDLESVQDQGQLFNVASNKQPAPEVSLFFSPSDPRPGEKITAKAFPIYFTNKEEELYYSWYLKRADCDLTNSPSASVRTLCDRDNDRRITVEDWKIEAARILVQNGYDSSATSYATDTDNDGYRARFGGDNKTNTPNYCYYHDNASGINYEIADTGNTTFDCPDGKTPVCLIEEQGLDDNSDEDDNEFLEAGSTDECVVSGLPYCGGSGVANCNVGRAYCVTEPSSGENVVCSQATTLSTCDTTTTASANPICRHLFPDAPGETSGDADFNEDEERFWGTDPNDPDTADSGNKDEANIVGLGRISFTWNYSAGDQVGVAVEGASMIPTKHDNASFMTMWAFPKKDCPISLAEGTGSYTTRVKNYSVEIETADINLNDCIARNLVDPVQGGQATNMEVQVSATPDDPINDESDDKAGDLVIAQASVSNGRQGTANTFFEWTVEVSNNIQFSAGIGPTANITGDLQDLGLIGNTEGNALDTFRTKLDIPRSQSVGGRPLSSYLSNDVGYLRFTARVTENFDNNISRKGRSDVIVKFVSTGRKISAYKVEPVLSGDRMQVSLPDSGGVICNDDALDRTLCRVIKNEIIGLRIDPTGLSNFSWSINGVNFSCTASRTSPDCRDSEQNEINFFPVSGNVGDTYTVTLLANDVESGKTITLSRSFQVIDPILRIISADENTAWPKLLGQYRDITGQATGCPDGLCNDYSKDLLEGFSGETLKLEAKFVPSFLESVAEKEWEVDGQTVPDATSKQIEFLAEKPAANLYGVKAYARVTQTAEARRALYDIWNISPLDSTEILFSSEVRVELFDPALVQGEERGIERYFAALATYIPASLLFAFRVFLSGALILFASAFLMAVLPQSQTARSEKAE